MLVYLASPYSKYPKGREAAYREVCKKAAALMETGVDVFCPIAHSHSIEQEGMTEIHSGDFWLKQDFAILDKCDAVYVYMMDSWQDSYGVTKEIERAHRLSIPVIYLPFIEIEEKHAVV